MRLDVSVEAHVFNVVGEKSNNGYIDKQKEHMCDDRDQGNLTNGSLGPILIFFVFPDCFFLLALVVGQPNILLFRIIYDRLRIGLKLINGLTKMGDLLGLLVFTITIWSTAIKKRKITTAII